MIDKSVFKLLKRSDESYVVENAHKNPKLLGDYVRTMAKEIIKKFSHLSDDAVITIKQINEESIIVTMLLRRWLPRWELRSEIARG